MDPIQAINVLSQVVKTARLPYNEHVVLERCVDVLTQAVQAKTGGNGALESDAGPVTFEEPDVVEAVEAPKPKAKARARARKGGK